MERDLKAIMEGRLDVERTYLNTINCGSRDCDSAAWAIL